MSHIVHVKCVSHAFESKNALQYFPGYEYDIDLSDKDQRRLVYLKTLGGRWVFSFDRANSSSTANRIFFCKDCGQPFDRLQDLGNHTKTAHPPDKKEEAVTRSIEEEEEEERLLQERRAAEQEEEIKARQGAEAK